MASRREGQNLGPYRLIEQIGEGGMATVYKAYQPSMERHVAVKILPPHYADDPQFAERFIREARTIAKLEHQNILPVYDFGEEADTTYLVMRYLEGGTLKQVMKQGRLALSDIQQLFSQICSALDYAHRQGVIHRDVKPANIMIDKEGAVYLTDFGIAKVLKGVSQLTATGAAIGTPTYMAPEQSLAKGVDARSDTYALGVILYEMVVGKVPYEADTPMAVALAHIHEPLPLPREMDPAIPEPVEAVILKALAKEPDDRFQTARELAAALREAVRQAAVRPKPAEATLVDLVAEAWTGQQAAVTRVEEPPAVEEALPEAPVVEEPALKETVVEEPAGEEPAAEAEVPPTVFEAPPALEELPDLGEAMPGRRFPVRAAAIGAGGIAVVALVVIGAMSGWFGGGDPMANLPGSTPLAQALAPSGPTATWTLWPTYTARPPTATPTPLSTSPSGLTIYDDFNVEDGRLDRYRWWNTKSTCMIRDQILKCRITNFEDPETFDRPTIDTWIQVRDSGSVRLSYEVSMRLDSTVQHTGLDVDARLDLGGPEQDWHWFVLGYDWYQAGRELRLHCGGGSSNWAPDLDIPDMQAGFDEWHTFRFDIQEIPGSPNLAVVGYVDGIQLCSLTPPEAWQNAVRGDSKLLLGFNLYWSGDWIQEDPWEIWMDDVAIWPTLDN